MTYEIFITFVESEGPFLKIWGHTDPNMALFIEKKLQHLANQFNQNLFLPTPGSIQIGAICCVKSNDGHFSRVTITNIIDQNQIEVLFIDYGHKDIVPIVNIRSISNIPIPLLQMAPQAKDFLLAGITQKGQIWDEHALLSIKNEIIFKGLQYILIATVGIRNLIQLSKDGIDIVPKLVNLGLVSSIPISTQQQILLSSNNFNRFHHPIENVEMVHSMQTLPTFQHQIQPEFLTYKSFTLEPGSEHDVYVSYVSDGPCHFSLQLQKLEDQLARLMKEINRMPLKPLENDPLPGTVCVARCTEDNHICRAVVTSVEDNLFKVYYVDFGNTEKLSIDNLYTIPFRFVIPKVMAIRYALTGLDRSSVTVGMKCAFKEFVKEKLLRMRVFHSMARSTPPLCELWDGNGISVLEVIIRAALLAYPEPIQLNRGFSQEVKVSYVYSCSRFYVQLKSKEEELKRVMAELQENCPYKSQLNLEQINLREPCCALFEADGLWYRVEVLNVEQSGSIKVLYVDYGNEEEVTVDKLRIPQAELLTMLRPQAIECSLNGYQKMDPNLERDNFLEEIVLEKYFTMKVVEMLGKKAIIELTDSNKYNVASLLLDKIASAHSQASRMLIQDGNRVEHRKHNHPTVELYTPKHRRDDNRNDDNRNWNKKNDEGGSSAPGGGDDQNDWRKRKPMPRDEKFNRRTDNAERDSFKKNVWEDNRDNKNGWNDKGPRDRRKNNDWFRNDRRNAAKSPSGSDKSFSDTSETNWRSKKSSNYRSDTKKWDRGESKGGFSQEKSSWSKQSNFNQRYQDKPHEKPLEPLDAAAPDDKYLTLELLEKTEQVSISWFHNPALFFCQLDTYKDEFQKLMQNILKIYKSRPSNSTNLCVGSPVIALFPDDKVFYRAEITEILGYQFKVKFIDYGNVSVTDKIWPIDKKLMELPAQAVCCSLSVAPLEENWLNADNYSNYFNKEKFTCNFTQFVDDKYLVELYDNCTNVAELLIEASLVKALESSGSSICPGEFLKVKYPDKVELSLLYGQQIRVTLASVNSLEDFNVILPNGIEISCGIYNISAATQTWPETLLKIVGYTVIVYVANVLENRVEVSVYDSTGSKLQLIEPDEGSFEWVSQLCPMPVLTSEIACWVSHISDSKSAFIQPSDFGDVLNNFIETMLNSYNDLIEENELDIQEGFIYAVHSEDGNWYRGQITAILEEDSVTVFYLDYGNSETVKSINLKNLRGEHLDLHMLALEVSFKEPLEEIPENEIYVKLANSIEGWLGEIISDEIISDNREAETTSVDLEIPPQVPSSIGISIVVSHCDSPNEFYVQSLEAIESIEALQTNLQEVIVDSQDLENLTAGIVCAAQYSIDGLWYRCQVLDADSDITSVRFIDYGNTDVLDNNVAKAKTLPPELLTLEQYARRCSLCLKPDGEDEEWSETVCERFRQLVEVENLEMTVVHQDEKTTYVELFTNGEKISDRLLEEGFAKQVTFETESSCTGFVSHLNSPSEFWIQLENSVGDLERTAERLSSAEKFKELEDFSPGSLCAALFPDDEMWYRARILSNTVAGIEVIFIDYGNSCTCSGFRQLPEDLIMLSPLALKCSLEKPNGIVQWSPRATEIFKEISQEGATIFNVRKITTGETSVVELYVDGENVVNQLLPDTSNGFVSHFESMDEFWIQKDEDTERLDVLMKKMLEVSEWPEHDKGERFEEGELVAAQYPDDAMWYRAEILKARKESDKIIYTVLFFDYGNSSDTEDVKVLPEEMRNELPIAIKCKLDPLPGYKWTEQSSEKLASLINEGETTFQIEFVSDDVVRLYFEGKDVRIDLNGVPSSSATNSPKKANISEGQGESVAREIVNDICEYTVNESKLIAGDILHNIYEEITKENELLEVEEKQIELKTEDETTDVRSEIVSLSVEQEQIEDNSEKNYEKEKQIENETTDVCSEIVSVSVEQEKVEDNSEKNYEKEKQIENETTDVRSEIVSVSAEQEKVEDNSEKSYEKEKQIENETTDVRSEIVSLSAEQEKIEDNSEKSYEKEKQMELKTEDETTDVRSEIVSLSAEQEKIEDNSEKSYEKEKQIENETTDVRSEIVSLSAEQEKIEDNSEKSYEKEKQIELKIEDETTDIRSEIVSLSVEQEKIGDNSEKNNEEEDVKSKENFEEKVEDNSTKKDSSFEEENLEQEVGDHSKQTDSSYEEENTNNKEHLQKEIENQPEEINNKCDNDRSKSENNSETDKIDPVDIKPVNKEKDETAAVKEEKQ